MLACLLVWAGMLYGFALPALRARESEAASPETSSIPRGATATAGPGWRAAGGGSGKSEQEFGAGKRSADAVLRDALLPGASDADTARPDGPAARAASDATTPRGDAAGQQPPASAATAPRGGAADNAAGQQQPPSAAAGILTPSTVTCASWGSWTEACSYTNVCVNFLQRTLVFYNGDDAVYTPPPAHGPGAMAAEEEAESSGDAVVDPAEKAPAAGGDGDSAAVPADEEHEGGEGGAAAGGRQLTERRTRAPRFVPKHLAGAYAHRNRAGVADMSDAAEAEPYVAAAIGAVLGRHGLYAAHNDLLTGQVMPLEPPPPPRAAHLLPLNSYTRARYATASEFTELWDAEREWQAGGGPERRQATAW
jgi:hypothetical protein